MISRTNIVLAVLLLLVILVSALSRVDYSRPNYMIVLPADMGRSPAYSAYSPNNNFEDGRTLQAPVVGTIARGDLPLRYTATKEDAARAGEELENPYALQSLEVQPPSAADRKQAPDETADTSGDVSRDEKPEEAETAGDLVGHEQQQAQHAADLQQRLQASIQRGSEVYRIFCITCHGPSGGGDGLVAQRGFPPPPSMLTGKSMQMKDGQLFHILSYGQGSMSPMAAQLSHERRWDVINFVRELQKAAPKNASATPDTLQTSDPAATDQDEPPDEAATKEKQEQ